jgi:hypothetical protein
MHPLIDRVYKVRRTMARDLWEPVSITLGWLTHDFLCRDLAGESYPPKEGGQILRILGIAIYRSTEFPIGGSLAFEREIHLSPYERKTEQATVQL